MHAQDLCLSRSHQGSSTGKGIVEGGQLVAVKQLLCLGMASILSAGITPALPDLIPGLLKKLLIGGVLPLDQILDNFKEPLSFLFLLLLGCEQIGMGRWIVHHL